MRITVVCLVDDLKSADPPVEISTPQPPGLGARLALATLFSAVSVALLIATIAFVRGGQEPLWIRVAAATVAGVIILGLWSLMAVDAARSRAGRQAALAWPDARGRAVAHMGLVTACRPTRDDGEVLGFKLTIETAELTMRANVSTKGNRLTPRLDCPARVWLAGRDDAVVIEVVAH